MELQYDQLDCLQKRQYQTDKRMHTALVLHFQGGLVQKQKEKNH